MPSSAATARGLAQDLAAPDSLGADEVPGDLMDCYALFCEPVLAAFDRMGVDADFASAERDAIYHPSCYLRDIHPAHDVVAPASASAWPAVPASRNASAAWAAASTAEKRSRPASS